MGLRYSLDAVECRKIPSPCWDQNPAAQPMGVLTDILASSGLEY
jgi:hypothetical protein